MKRQITLIFLTLLVLFLFLGLRDELKLRRVLAQENQEGLLSVEYGNGRSVPLYLADGEREDAGQAYVFLPSFADPASLTVVSPAANVIFTDPEGQEIRVRGCGRKTVAFQENVPYEVRFLGITGKTRRELTVTFLKSGKLPTIYVTTDSKSMEWLDADKDRKEEGRIEILDPEGRTLLADELKSISGRGNQTFRYEKKSYHVKLSQAADLFEMGESDSWILLSNVYDPSYLRNKLTYDMAVQAGMEGSTESVYADVYLNGRYNGVYLLCEKIELGENRLDMTSLEKENRESNDRLKEAEAWISEDGSRKGVKAANVPADITGSYLIEHDYAEKYDAELSGFITDTGEKYVLKNPEHAMAAEVNYIADRMQEIEDAISAEDGCSPKTGTHYTEYIDLESWADKYIVEEITKNNAGGLTSSFFYKKPDSVSTKIFGGPVWDFDKGFGRVENFNQNTTGLSYLTLHDGESTLWFYYLSKQPEFMEMVRKEYAEKFSDYLGEMAEEKIEAYTESFEASAKLDSVRFAHIYEEYHEQQQTYQERGAYIRQFITERKAFLDAVWIQGVETCEIRFENEAGRLIYVEAVEKGRTPGRLPGVAERGEPDVDRWVLKGTDESLTENTPVLEDMTVVGIWDK